MVVKVDPRAENLDKLFLIYADVETQDGDTFCSF